jgi:hypothetical protein
MKPGSVIIDIAGGNCELTRKGEAFTTANGVTIVGYTDYPSRMAVQASEFYASNLVNLLEDMCGHPDGAKTVVEEPAAKGFWVNMEITREQSDTTIESCVSPCPSYALSCHASMRLPSIIFYLCDTSRDDCGPW